MPAAAAPTQENLQKAGVGGEKAARLADAAKQNAGEMFLHLGGRLHVVVRFEIECINSCVDIAGSQRSDKKVEPIRNRGQRVGRNDPCPCGSGKKYKNCCMRTAV